MATNLNAAVHGNPPTNVPPAVDAAEPRRLRGEEILGFPVKKSGKRWKVEEVEITPGKATMILATMPPQRSLYSRKVEEFVDLIRSGRFVLTHQGIAFNEDGGLIDGQHRLNACVEAGMPIKVEVTFNQPKATFRAFDRGKGRNAVDDATVMGLTSGGTEGAILVAAARILWHLENGRLPWQTGSSSRIDGEDVGLVLELHPKLKEHVAMALTGRKSGTAGAVLAAFGTLFEEAAPSLAQQFITQITTGEGLYEGDPALAYRRYIERSNMKHRNTRAMSMIALVHAWNAFIEGRKLEKVVSKLGHDGSFPGIAKPKSARAKKAAA